MSEDRHLQFLAKIEEAKRKKASRGAGEPEAAASQDLADTADTADTADAPTAAENESGDEVVAVAVTATEESSGERPGVLPEVEESMVVEVSDMEEEDSKSSQPRDKRDILAEDMAPLATRKDSPKTDIEVLGPDYYDTLWEASRCLYCYDPPCIRLCPVGINIPEISRRIANGDVRGAARILLGQNPLGNLCGRVCPTELLCEGGCVLHQSTRRPIAIRKLEGYLSARAMNNGIALALLEGPRRKELASEKIGKVAIIGAGPAGLSCAIELKRLGHEVTVFDKNKMAGGLATHAIPFYKISVEAAEREAQLMERVGLDFRFGKAIVEGDDLAELQQQFDIICLAVGLSVPLTLGIEGEKLERIVDGLEMIISQRQRRQLPVKIKDQVVIVVGGGNVAMFSAMLAMELGARQAVAVYRRTMAQMPADPDVVRMARQMGVMLIFEHEPVAIHGAGVVKALECRATTNELDGSKLDGSKEAKRRNLVLPCQVIVRAIGYRVADVWSKCFDGVLIDGGLIAADPETGRTGNPRIFAGGDCTNGGRRVVYAVRDGRRVAAAIHRQLVEQEATL